jgi:hypothetical protein
MFKEITKSKPTDSPDFNEEVFNSLSEDGKKKVELIYYLATILAKEKLDWITPEKFDILYDYSPKELAERIGAAKERIHLFNCLGLGGE